MNTNKILSMATVLLLGTATQAAIAQGMTSPYKIASETADVGSSTTSSATNTFVIPGSTVFDVPVMPNRAILSTSPYFVVVTLTGGAQFSGAGVNLLCGYSATLASGSAAGNIAVVDSPAAAANGTIAAFKVQSAGANGALTSCQLQWSVGSGIILTSGNKDYGISITNRHQDGSDPISATVAGTIVTFAQGVQLSVSAGSVTIDVVSPSLSKNFLVSGSVLSSTTAGTSVAVADLGVIRYTPASDVYTLTGGTVSAGTYLTTATIVVSGSVISNAVSATSGSTVTGVIFLGINSETAIAGGCSAILSGGTAPSAAAGVVASGNQVSFSVSGSSFNSAAASTNSGIHVCMIPNGITILEKGTVSFQVNTVSSANNSKPNLTSTNTVLTTVVKNGTSVKVLNIPSPDYTVDVTYVRFYNMGTVTGKVFGTLYSQGTTDGNNTGGGSFIGTPGTALIDSLAPGQVVVLSGPALGTKFGVNTWPGRAWLQVESEVKGLRVQALVRSGGITGTLTNMSDRVMADGEVQQRNE